MALHAGVVCWRRAGVAEMTLDLDSTVCEVCGRAKHGAAYGHTKVLGYHPLVAVRSDTGEVLHSRMRSGSSQRGNVHFARETLARVRRLAADATVTVRADSGFFSYDMISHRRPRCVLLDHDPTERQGQSAEAIGEAPSSPTPAAARPRWLRPPSRPAAAATSYRAADGKPAKLRLVTRRSRLLGAQRELWPNWRYHCFVDLAADAPKPRGSPSATQRRARRCPSGRRQRRLARLQRAAHLARWTARLAKPTPLNTPSRHHPRHRTGPPRRHHRLRLPLNLGTQPPPYDTSALPHSSELSAPRSREPHRHQPAPAPHSSPARHPPAAHSTSPGHPAPTADPTSPSVDPGLVAQRGPSHLRPHGSRRALNGALANWSRSPLARISDHRLALVIGAVGSVLCLLATKLLEKIKVDDRRRSRPPGGRHLGNPGHHRGGRRSRDSALGRWEGSRSSPLSVCKAMDWIAGCAVEQIGQDSSASSLPEFVIMPSTT